MVLLLMSLSKYFLMLSLIVCSEDYTGISMVYGRKYTNGYGGYIACIGCVNIFLIDYSYRNLMSACILRYEL